jgi:hypothetical protein
VKWELRLCRLMGGKTAPYRRAVILERGYASISTGGIASLILKNENPESLSAHQTAKPENDPYER